jgi:hypothetical protein
LKQTFLSGLCLFVVACGTQGEKTSASSRPQADAGSVQEGILEAEDGWVLRTAPMTVGPGEEKYFCYAAAAQEDLEINRFSFTKTPGVHHFMFNEASTPQPDGLRECNVFTVTGQTLFTATTADVELDTPAGSAKRVTKGSQLVLQTHMFNTTEAPITSSVDIRMQKSQDKDPEPVGILAFGSLNIDLPPHQTTTVEAICRIQEDSQFFAIVPHMHYLGTRAELAFGTDVDSFQTVYVRDPFSFDDQHFDPFTNEAPAGTMARVRCIYNNDTDQTVHFGESSHDEMCNVPGFIVGRDGVTLCTLPLPDGGVPRAPNSGTCGTSVTPSGIGKLCTPGGGECGSGLTCSADQLQMAIGICARVGCESNDDCEGATCCTESAVAGIANFCIPEACRPTNCIPVGAH